MKVEREIIGPLILSTIKCEICVKKKIIVKIFSIRSLYISNIYFLFLLQMENPNDHSKIKIEDEDLDEFSENIHVPSDFRPVPSPNLVPKEPAIQPPRFRHIAPKPTSNSDGKLAFDIFPPGVNISHKN